MFGVTPSHGFYIRHANGVRLRDVRCETIAPDARPAFVVEKANDIVFSGSEGARRPGEGADFVLRRVRDITVRERTGHEDKHVAETEREAF